MRIRTFIIAAVLAVSCNGVQPEAVEQTVIEAGLDESRTALGDKAGSSYSIVWTSSDVMCVNGKKSSSITIKSDPRKATFTFSGVISGAYNAVCPASAVKSYSEGSYSVNLPSTQTWTDGSYDPASTIICGVGSNGDVTLSNAMAFLRIVPASAGGSLRLRKIVVSAPDARLSGSFTVNCATASLTPASGSSDVTLDCGGNGIAFGTTVIVAIPAGVYPSGIALRIIDTDNHFQDIRSTASFSASAGVMYKTSPFYVPAGTIVDAGSGDVGDSSGGESGRFSNPVRVGIMGDSISTFSGWIPTGWASYYPASKNDKSLTEVEQTWWYRLIYDYMPNATLDRNLSYSGSLVTKRDDGRPQDNLTFPTRCSLYEDPDIIIIHGGTNDRGKYLGYMPEMGSYDYSVPIDELNIRQFRPAYIKTIRQLQANYPGVKIVCLINSVLYVENLDDPTNNYILLAQSIQAIADHYKLPVVSLKDVTLSTLDNLHPDSAGADQLAQIIYSRLQQEGILEYRRN